jgi:hypothetical protein
MMEMRANEGNTGRAAIDSALTAVEIKLIARERDEDVVRVALDLVDRDPEHRDIYFFDTPALELFDAGLVLRARQIRDDADDSTVKIRPYAIDDRRLVGIQGVELELDEIGDETVRSAKLSAKPTTRRSS